MMSNSDEIPFGPGEWVVDLHNPGRPGIFTGKTQQQGPFTLVELEYGPGDRRFRPLDYLESANQGRSNALEERISQGLYGTLADFRRLITFEKLKGTLHEVIYSMEAAQIDFYPYQFKPVVKFIDSPTERMVIADEVGLGKTIEAALIWVELQARKQAKRLLVLCPTQILARKWKDELRAKFIIDARVAKFTDVQDELEELRRKGSSHPFALIATYNGLRPTRKEHRFLDEMPGETERLSPQTRFCQVLRSWDLSYDPFDLVIFDEAHHMRNAGTANFHLGESLSANSGAILCVSATPVNNRNEDLHSILRLIDDDFFRTQALFGQLLEANRPAVQLSNALARSPVDMNLLATALEGLGKSPFVSKSPLFSRLLDMVEKLDMENHAHVSSCQNIAEKLNLLGNYITRTRRIQVKEHRPVRDPVVLEVNFTEEEMALYKAIVGIVRRRCEIDDRPFHVFQVIGMQMRAASSLAVLAHELKSGKLGDPFDLLCEAFGDDDINGSSVEDLDEESFDSGGITELLAYDFEGNDSKYQQLERHILENLADEKIVIFSFYRGTLHYLQRRLARAGVDVVLIHGDIKHDERKEIVDSFNSAGGPQVLLSSEVGSEGIDMHEYCRCLVNYDLPWNPMRVEQRIGRIDRVGQKAEKLAVIHLKVKGTIEERVYDRLHHRLEIFANSLGDLESIIGNVVQDLTVELLSNQLTPEQEEQRIEEKERVIQGKLNDLKILEESGEGLLALADYVQKKIDEDRGKGRFVRPDELEVYLQDFFEREFRGTTIDWDSPAAGCITIRPSHLAQQSLSDYIKDDKSLSARPLRQRQFSVTFRKESHKALHGNLRRGVHFANHLSPLIRWMTHIYAQNSHNFFNLSSAVLETDAYPEGCWVYRVERWFLRGLRNQERLAYCAINIQTNEILRSDKAEGLVQETLKAAKEWDFSDFDKQLVVDAHSILTEQLRGNFEETIAEFLADNQHSCQIRTERARNLFDRRISQVEKRLNTLKEKGRSANVIRLMEVQLTNALNNKERKLAEIDRKSRVDCEKSEVAAGIINIRHIKN
jgi:superfamily II DNA or RNA helicase